MKEKFKKPVMEVIEFDAEDIICSSCGIDACPIDGCPDCPGHGDELCYTDNT